MNDCLNQIEKINIFLNKQDIPTIECFSEKEKEELFENILNKIDSYLKSDILYMKEVDFHKTLKNDILDIIILELDVIVNDAIVEEIIELIDDAEKYYFDFLGLKRSHDKTLIVENINVSKIKKIIDKIKNKPQPEQRTDEWYEFRHNLITASNAWKAFEGDSFRNSLIYEKCRPINKEKFGFVNMDSPFHWGHKYEPISVEIYQKRYDTIVDDFGCIKDDKYKFLGVSPDGINTDEKSPIYGRMLEIKNIVNREIDGIPKKEYWVQMQMQMNVCSLNECDFLETKFVEYNDYEDFLKDGTFNTSINGNEKGIMICFIKDGIPHYEYCPLGLNKNEFEEWEKKMVIKNSELEWFKNVYWKLEIFSCVLVERNKEWFDAALPFLERCWEIIEYERINGFEHRAPKKRQIKQEVKITRCLIDLKSI